MTFSAFYFTVLLTPYGILVKELKEKKNLIWKLIIRECKKSHKQLKFKYFNKNIFFF